jgi:hypothetical protein
MIVTTASKAVGAAGRLILVDLRPVENSIRWRFDYRRAHDDVPLVVRSTRNGVLTDVQRLATAALPAGVVEALTVRIGEELARLRDAVAWTDRNRDRARRWRPLRERQPSHPRPSAGCGSRISQPARSASLPARWVKRRHCSRAGSRPTRLPAPA